MGVPITVQQAVDEYVQSLRDNDNKPGYVRDVSLTLAGITREHGPKQLRNLRDQHLSDVFTLWTRGSGIVHPKNMPSTLNKKREHVRMWLKFSQAKGWIKADPKTLLLLVKKRKAGTRKFLRLTPAQIIDWINRPAHARDRCYFALAAYTAIRQMEICTLRWGQVDLEQGTINVVNSKTDNERVLPITVELDRAIREWVEFYESRIGRPLRGADYLLPAKAKPTFQHQGGKLRKGSDVPLFPERHMMPDAKMVKAIWQDMKLPHEREGLHTIRRSVARIFYDQQAKQYGKDHALSMTQAFLDHASPTQTQKYIGVDYFADDVDETLRGRAFLSDLLPTDENVVQFKPRAENG